MDNEQLMEHFFQAIAQKDYQRTVELFTENAVMHFPPNSPMAGKQRPREIYKDLFAKVKNITVQVRDMYICPDSPEKAIAHIDMRVTFIDDKTVQAESLDLFEFSNGKIQSLRIINAVL